MMETGLSDLCYTSEMSQFGISLSSIQIQQSFCSINQTIGVNWHS
jgi:hypothetical protein